MRLAALVCVLLSCQAAGQERRPVQDGRPRLARRAEISAAG